MIILNLIKNEINSKFNKFYFWLLFFGLLKLKFAHKNFIDIPFHLKKINKTSEYNSTNFLNDFYNREILIHLKIGTPIQNVFGTLGQVSEIFTMKEDKSNNLIYNKNNYFPNKSSSIDNRYSGIIIDKIIFEEKNESLTFQIKANNYKKNTNFSYIPTIGLNIPNIYSPSTQNFFLYLKRNNLINKLIWTIAYNSDKEGNFIIGENLTEYNSIKYPAYNYYTLYFQLKYFIFFDSVYIENKLIYNLNSTNVFISINSGFIVGPKEYKNLIDKIYFNDLIDRNICQSEAIRYIFNNNKKQTFYYYVYSCKDKLFSNYYNNFPKLIFSLKSIEYNFEFKNMDLFIHINDKYYFLIIFLKDVNKKEETWYFGEPFYKKFPFSMDFDARTLGFYIDKKLEKKDKIKKIIIQKKILLII